MSEDLVAGYERAIDGLVDLIERFPNEQDAFGTGATEDADLLTGVVDEYAAWAGGLFDRLIARASDEATRDRLFALAAGDFRLAVELIRIDDPSAADEREAEERAADADALSAALGDLRVDMDEVKAAVRGAPDDTHGGSAIPEPQPEPSSGPSRAGIPPLHEFVVIKAHEFVTVAPSRELAREQVRALSRPVSGAAADSVELVHSHIDAILEKASSELADLAIGGVAVGIDIAAEFSNLLAGELGSFYQHVQEKLRGFKQRAKRSALKLLYEGIDKLLSVLRHAMPIGAPTPERVRDMVAELAEWMRDFVLTEAIRKGLDRVLRVGDLKSHVETTFAASDEDERAERAVRVGSVAKKYRDKKFPMTYGRVAVRAVRFLGLHHIAPPWGEVAMGCTILALSGVSGWMAQDALDHPDLWFVPDLSPGVRSAVDGT
jgi:hypothetical protein